MKKPNRSPSPLPRRRLVAGAAALASALAWCAPALAEKADRDKPIHLEADQANVDDARQVATFIGNVVLIQGTLIIRADRMVVKQDTEGFQYGTAWGNPATFRQKREGHDEYVDGKGERLEYDGRADKVQFFNRAWLRRGQDEVFGSYISYDANTEFFQVTGGGKNAITETSPRGRVRAVIQPKNKAQPAQPAAPVAIKPSDSLSPARSE